MKVSIRKVVGAKRATGSNDSVVNEEYIPVKADRGKKK